MIPSRISTFVWLCFVLGFVGCVVDGVSVVGGGGIGVGVVVVAGVVVVISTDEVETSQVPCSPFNNKNTKMFYKMLMLILFIQTSLLLSYTFYYLIWPV